jgi:hypothetical protein
VAEPVPVAVEQAPPPGGHSWTPVATAGVVTASAGVVLAGVGVAFALSANSKYDRLHNAPAYDPALEDSAKQARTLEAVFLGMGAAAVATGAILVVIGHQGDGGTALLPVIDQRGVRLALARSF